MLAVGSRVPVQGESIHCELATGGRRVSVVAKGLDICQYFTFLIDLLYSVFSFSHVYV